MNRDHFDYDYIIIGSGFGGSVSALRLSEKGYRVMVLEKGRWFTPDNFALRDHFRNPADCPYPWWRHHGRKYR